MAWGWVAGMSKALAHVEIVEVDPKDDAALREFHEVEQSAIVEDRPDQLSRSFDALANSVRHPNPYRSSTLLTALVDGAVVGTAQLDLELQDNQHLAGSEINVAPVFRRRGIGRALHDEVTTRRRAAGRPSIIGEVYVVGDSSAGFEFATALGYRSAHVEAHLVLDLPPSVEALDALAARAEPALASYEIVTWGDRSPDEYAEAYCAMKTQMADDVPTGELDHEPIVVDLDRLRTTEERTARSYHQLIAAARRTSDGTMSGYSQMFLPHGEGHVIQDDTLVMPDHRGHRLGTALKLANLRAVLDEHPERQRVHTWTALGNEAMLRTNADFGFRQAELMHEMQLEDPR
ncbi:MAG: family N-acetyltransferase [Nocardioides sp.]|nr:family N-acetyltransferase [Nocardioides sp.]